MNLDRIEPEQQILTKAPRRHLARKIGVGRRENAHVDASRPGGTDPLHFPGLQHPQELGLLPEAERPDLVQQERATLRQLESADPVGARIGERALHVAEHLALEQTLGEPAEIDRHQRPGRARRGGVQPLGHDFLAGPVLAADEDVRIGGRHAVHELEDRPHRGGLRDQLGRAVPAQQPILALQPARAPERAAELDLGPQRRQQPGVVPRLLDEVASATPHRLHRLLDAAPGGHHHRGQRAVERLELGYQLESLASGRGIARVVKVEQDGVEIRRLDGGKDRGGRSRGVDGVALALEQQPERLTDVGLIVRDEHVGDGGGVGGRHG